MVKFYVPTWSIFAGPVTIVIVIILILTKSIYSHYICFWKAIGKNDYYIAVWLRPISYVRMYSSGRVNSLSCNYHIAMHVAND